MGSNVAIHGMYYKHTTSSRSEYIQPSLARTDLFVIGALSSKKGIRKFISLKWHKTHCWRRSLTCAPVKIQVNHN